MKNLAYYSTKEKQFRTKSYNASKAQSENFERDFAKLKSLKIPFVYFEFMPKVLLRFYNTTKLNVVEPGKTSQYIQHVLVDIASECDAVNSVLYENNEWYLFAFKDDCDMPFFYILTKDGKSSFKIE